LVQAIVSATGNWRVAFWSFGVVGLVWAAVWLALFRDNPADDPKITPQELLEIGERRHSGSHAGAPWGRLFSHPQLWLVMVMYSFYVWGSTFYLYWLHTYLVKGRGFSEAEMRSISSLPFVLGALANPLGGILSDALSRRLGLKIGRRLMGSTCLAAGAAFMFCAAQVENRWSAVALLAVGFGTLDLMLSSAWAVCVDLGGRYAGAVSGAMNSFGHIGGALCSVLFGHIVERFGSYNAPLVVIAGMVLTAAVLFAFIDASRPLVPEDEAPAVTSAAS
jgi:nitrate/nitrite transporter NarK